MSIIRYKLRGVLPIRDGHFLIFQACTSLQIRNSVQPYKGQAFFDQDLALGVEDWVGDLSLSRKV